VGASLVTGNVATLPAGVVAEDATGVAELLCVVIVVVPLKQLSSPPHLTVNVEDCADDPAESRRVNSRSVPEEKLTADQIKEVVFTPGKVTKEGPLGSPPEWTLRK